MCAHPERSPRQPAALPDACGACGLGRGRTFQQKRPLWPSLVRPSGRGEPLVTAVPQASWALRHIVTRGLVQRSAASEAMRHWAQRCGKSWHWSEMIRQTWPTE